jgi:hypothetical protein
MIGEAIVGIFSLLALLALLAGSPSPWSMEAKP